MSIGGSLSGITFSGLSSGIDTDTMVQRLIQLEAIPITRLQQQQAQLTSRMGVLNQFKSRLTALATAAGALNSATAFNPMQAASSAADVATITATSSAGAGTYALKVSKLAQAQKVASEAQVGTTVALGQAGTFVLNGKAISVEASDTLTNIAQKINGAGAGVTASVINGGDNNAYLTISASRTGAANSIQMADATGSVLASLGVLSGSVQARLPITGGFAGYGLSSSTASAASAMGASALPSGTITVNGVGIAIDLNADSLQDISNRINTSGSGATASVASIVKDGVTTHRLEITGVTQPTLIDDQNILQTLGIYQQAAGSEILVAQDATYSLDDIPLTSETNTITSVIPGATITLLRADETSPPASTLTLSRDDADIVKKVKAFMDAYNATVDFIKTNSSFNKDTFQSGPLFGESSVRQVESELSTILFNTVHSGGAFTNLTQVGFDFDESGKLTLDEAKLTQALSTDPNSVSTLFRAVGVGSNNTLQYISSTNRSRPGATPYDIEITQVATRGSYLAATAQTSANPGNETLTFSGSLFGSSSYQLVLEVGSTLASTIAKINSDPKLRDLVSASDQGGTLKITSRRYGTTGNFTVESNLAAASDNSGIGMGSPGTSEAGVDVAGTINGEPATGNGQFLTGSNGNATTEGLQIQYTGTATGLVGSMSFSKGVGSLVNDMVGAFTDGVNGLLTATDQGIQAQIDVISESITRLQERLARREQDLRARFSRMEDSIARIQSQASRLAALNLQTNR